MIIDCISDLHGHYPKLEGGDLLILAGDYTASDKITQWAEFFNWLKEQPYQNKVLIAGNHDRFFESGFPKTQKEADELKEVQSFLRDMGEMVETDFEYLCDSGTEIWTEYQITKWGTRPTPNAKKLKIWGSPWTKWFPEVNPKCTAFMLKTEEELAEKWALIPEDTDILITHSPAYAIFDQIGKHKIDSVGSLSLGNMICNRNIKLHVFGHIHESYGYGSPIVDLISVNASHVNEHYKPVNKPIRVIL